MRKYIEIAKISIKEQMEYRFDVISGAAMSLVRVLMGYVLWKAIFADKTMVGDYTFPMMLTYYIVTTIIFKMNASGTMMWQFSDEIKNGRFSKYVVRPVNPIFYFISCSLSKSFITLLFNIGAFVIWIALFRNYFVLPQSGVMVAWAVLFALLGLSIMIQTNYFISMLSFKITEIAGMYLAILNVIDFLAGVFLPIALLPGGVQNVLKLLPYYYTVYFPASLYLNKGVEQIPFALVLMLFWNVVFIGFNLIMYKKMFRYYEGVGV